MIIGTEEIQRATRYVSSIYIMFSIFILVFLWTMVFSSAAVYLTFLSNNITLNTPEFHWVSIFLEVYYPDKSININTINNPCCIKLSTIFVDINKVYPIYFDLKSMHFFSFIKGEGYQVILTKWMYVTSGIILIQIPIFHFAVKTALFKAFDLAKTTYIVDSKLGENYLSDKITQTIASNIHHELKTPLTAIGALIVKNRALNGYILDLMGHTCNDCKLREISNNSLAKKYNLTISKDNLLYTNIKEKLNVNFKLMEDSIRNMFNTVNMIKTIKAIDGSSNMSLYDIIDTSINIFKMGSTYNFTSIIDHNLKNYYLIDLDPQSLSNIIINHTKNSLEANAQIVKFEFIKEYIDGDQNFINLNIIDDGRGVSKKIIKYIYDLRTSSKVNGTGVGMYICKTILNKFGGDEKIIYTDKYGTVFELKIPGKIIKIKEHNELT